MSDVKLDGWRVKPLVWEGQPADCYMQANTMLGSYNVGVEYGDEWYCSFDPHGGGSINVRSWLDGAHLAQAAAQADYEARILTALEPTTP